MRAAITAVRATSRFDARMPKIDPLHVQRGALLASAGMAGFALILWIAANWDGIGKMGRFAIAGGVLAAGGLGAIAMPAFVAPGMLVSFLATGALLALVGQTYQTGADTWQLFAAWAVLGLPFAMAARSDAVWTPWVAVVVTAAGLWQSVSGIAPTSTFLLPEAASSPSPILQLLSIWLLLLGISAMLSPASTWGDRYIGNRRWAFRLALLLTICNVATWGVVGIIGLGIQRYEFAVAALALLAAIAYWARSGSSPDVLTLSAVAFGIDAILVSGVIRAMLPNLGSVDALGFFLLGGCAAVIVAVSVVLVLKAMPARQPVFSNAEPPIQIGDQTGDLNGGPHARPWPVIVLSAFGALMAAIPLIAAFALLLGAVLMHNGPAVYVVGALALAGSTLTVGQAKSLFVEQLATIGMALGLGLVTYAIFRDLPDWAAGLVLGLGALGLANVVGRTWLAGLLGAIAATGIAMGIVHVPGLSSDGRVPAYLLTWSLMAAIWVTVVDIYDRNRDWLEPMPAPATLDAIATGAGVAVLLALSVGGGPTFMLDGMLGSSIQRVHVALPGGFAWVTPRQVLAVLLSAAAAQVIYRSFPVMRSALGAVVALVGLALSFFMPALGAVALILAVALSTGRRGMAVLAAIAILWVVGNFYYALSLTLTQKAAVLAVAATVLAGLAVVFAPDHVATAIETSSNEKTPPLAQAVHSAWLRAGVGGGLLLAGAVIANAIHEKEALIQNGAPVFVELVPVDPRSLMQGDYMALRFRLPDEAQRLPRSSMIRPHAIGRRDGTGIVQFTRIGTPREVIGPDEFRIELSPGARGWTVVTNAWFFKEGEAQKWQAARYGEFRVGVDGRALLVSLADKDRIAIK